MTRIARRFGRLIVVITTVAPALILMPAATRSPALGQIAGDPFRGLSVQRLAEPVAAPDLAFLTPEGREARLGELRGKVVLLGLFTAT